jgi:DNA polymerase-3 subunit gamma/tau
LRDLLVFKAKPDALKEDADPELQKALAVQSDLVENDRLLDLIDQFAQAEGRMKWAPNKKLHFEVAIIRAIQSLGQATLDQVIAKLGELRDGSPRDESVRTAAKTTTAEKKTLGAENVGAGPSRAATLPAASSSVAAAVSAAIVTKAADPPSPGSGVAGAAAPTTLKVAEAPNGETDVNKIWESAFARIPATKAFVRNSAAAAHVLPSEGRHFILGFSPDQKSTMDILGTATNRKLIESLLHEVSGRDWTLKLTVKDDLPSKDKPSEDYADNPLIRDALEIFKGEIKR